ncbi:hypothetical protein QBC37DRAFT_431154 [Rhypophila decipiens]|uniref:Uncharacterized protein n=1 Tax=Rhypophila decipiens TaxID=261697 RepID=A0AAN6XXS7_9PEZI|nr:hypothetical protein QBC37DRAFT_431154 [Rhypophila decipiens]
MPKQYVVCGRLVPRLGTRHTSLLFALISLFAVCSLFFLLPSGAIPARPNLNDYKFSVPKSFKSPWKNLNPFTPPAHPPPRQKNDTLGDTSWYSNWKWLSTPFSSSLTLDENRLILPVLPERTPIYCYYDNTIEKDKATKEVDSDLLLSWRRAWWSKGFKPIILGPADAMNNPRYEELQKIPDKLDPALKTDLMRWLAWENMGGGVLAHYLLFPMGDHNDPLLAFLRRGEFPKLTRWKNIDEGLFVGPKTNVAEAVKLALSSSRLKIVKEFLAAIMTDNNDPAPFVVDPTPKSLAYYSARTLASKYTKVADEIAKSHNKGFTLLNQLINSHLHLTWQNVFSDGIAVMKPLPHHTTHLISPAYELALRLTHCPESPLPSSCPPNMGNKCTPCVATQPMKLSTPAHLQNSSTTYILGTVPHPYTTASLHHLRPDLTIPWIRRESRRNIWLADLTAHLLGSGVSGAPRVLKFKESVASEKGASTSLWLLAERRLPEDLVNWHFGFAVPTEATWTSDGKSETPVPGPERRPAPPPHDPKDGPIASPEDLAKEPELLSQAIVIVDSDGKWKGKATKEQVAVKEAIEAWNLADTEAWRFARAYLARKRVVRQKWEEEEDKYLSGLGSEKKKGESAWNRWLDSSSKDEKNKEEEQEEKTGQGDKKLEEGKKDSEGKKSR